MTDEFRISLHYSALSSLVLYVIFIIFSWILHLHWLVLSCLFTRQNLTACVLWMNIWGWDDDRVTHLNTHDLLGGHHVCVCVNELNIWVVSVSGRRARFIMDKDDFRGQVVVLVQIWSEHARLFSVWSFLCYFVLFLSLCLSLLMLNDGEELLCFCQHEH